jgi:hypothetical protein
MKLRTLLSLFLLLPAVFLSGNAKAGDREAADLNVTVDYIQNLFSGNFRRALTPDVYAQLEQDLTRNLDAFLSAYEAESSVITKRNALNRFASILNNAVFKSIHKPVQQQNAAGILINFLQKNFVDRRIKIMDSEQVSYASDFAPPSLRGALYKLATSNEAL